MSRRLDNVNKESPLPMAFGASPEEDAEERVLSVSVSHKCEEVGEAVCAVMPAIVDEIGCRQAKKPLVEKQTHEIEVRVAVNPRDRLRMMPTCETQLPMRVCQESEHSAFESRHATFACRPIE